MSGYIVEYFEDRRTLLSPIPNHLERMLNNPQMKTLLELESLGWQLWFVRRPLNQPVLPVLYDPSFSVTAIIEKDGEKNTKHGMEFRPDHIH